MKFEEKNWAWYSSIETLGAVDGPGLRLIIFVQGCPLRCLFCHNPETIPYTMEKKITVDEIIEKYRKNEPFYVSNGGGITISGGEALGQPNFVLSLAKRCKKEGIHLTIDTAAGPFMGPNIEIIIEIAKIVPLFLIDLKHPNEEISTELTGYGFDNQLELIRLCEKLGTHYWVRHVYVPTFSDRNPEDMRKLGRIIGNLKYMDKFEILPYHDMMIPKYEMYNIPFKLGHVKPPTKEMVQGLRKWIEEGIIQVKQNPELSEI